jgi:hypothetical protein
MNDHYPQLRKFESSIDSIVDTKLSSKKPKPVTKGLLTRKQESMTKQDMQGDYNERIASYVMSIRNKRMGLKDVG